MQKEYARIPQGYQIHRETSNSLMGLYRAIKLRIQHWQ